MRQRTTMGILRIYTKCTIAAHQTLVWRKSLTPPLSKDSTTLSPFPFVKWAGGKSSLLPELLRHVPPQVSNYYEPFLGGGALFFAIYARNPHFNAHLSDINTDLINAYRTIKDKPDELIRMLSKFQRDYYHSRNKSEFFYDKRSWQPSNDVESTARLVFLNKTCYNGLYRVNSQGEFNVPFGRYKKPRILDALNIRAINQTLRDTTAQLSASNYQVSLSTCGENDFVYLDPPYQPKSKTSSFTDYTPGGFSETDQKELAKEFERLVGRGCTVLLSNSETPLTTGLYKRFKKRTVTVNRPISSIASGRTGYKELIVLGIPN